MTMPMSLPLRTIQRFSSIAAQKAAPQLSTVHRGNAFEERGLSILQDHLSMSLKRVGGKSDGGVDLQGWWWLPPSFSLEPAAALFTQYNTPPVNRRRLRVFAQCKAEKKKFSPNYVREMEGVLHRYLAPANAIPDNDRGGSVYPLVALLLSESAFTSATLLRAQSSPVPFFLLHLPQAESGGETRNDNVSKNHLGGAFWNAALGGHRGILGGQIEARWERAARGRGGRPGLWWQGQRLRSWTPDRDVDDVDDGFAVPELREI